MLQSQRLEEVLHAAGDLLESEGLNVSVVVVGGAALNILGFVTRTTDDIDVIAQAKEQGHGREPKLLPPEPLPEALQRAILRVARDFGLPKTWMNTEIGAQWRQGLPPWLNNDLIWRRYGGLKTGLAGRRTLIALKLFAATDQGPRSVHYQDLIALSPTEEELAAACAWVATQDASEAFASMLDQVMNHVKRDTRTDR